MLERVALSTQQIIQLAPSNKHVTTCCKTTLLKQNKLRQAVCLILFEMASQCILNSNEHYMSLDQWTHKHLIQQVMCTGWVMCQCAHKQFWKIQDCKAWVMSLQRVQSTILMSWSNSVVIEQCCLQKLLIEKLTVLNRLCVSCWEYLSN